MTFHGAQLDQYTIYMVCTAKPVYDVDGLRVYVCLPIDLDETGLPKDDTRYMSLVLVPTGTSSNDLCGVLSDFVVLSVKWLNVMTQRSW